MDTDLDSKFNAVLDVFHFKEVYTFMQNIDWTWGLGSENHVPTILEMRNMCSELFEYAKKAYSKKKKRITTVSSGGFEVSIYKDSSVEIRFILAETRYYAEHGEVY